MNLFRISLTLIHLHNILEKMNILKLKKFISHKIQTEISPELSYHGLHHTLAVLQQCNNYIKRLSIPSEDAYLLRTAALLHDIGILWDYSNHEESGINFIKKELPKWGYSTQQIETVCQLVDATKLPQRPTTLLEQILCDSDLDYLGTDLFYQIGETLYHEFLYKKIVNNRDEWNDLQIKFLSNHSYHTAYAKGNREPLKNQHLEDLIRKKKR